MRQKYFLIIAITISIIVLTTITNAALLGVNRANLKYDNVLRGGYSEQQITVTIGSPNSIPISFEARGEIAEWIRFEPEEQTLVINENNPGIINIIVEPPIDARVDSYDGLILITTGALGNVTSSMGTNVIVAFEVKVNVTLTDTQILTCTTGGIDLKDAEIGETNTLIANVKNTGNVRIRPGFDIKILSQMQDEVLKEIKTDTTTEIMPSKSALIENQIDVDLEPGQYWAEITEPTCGTKTLKTFSVLEKGGISDDGELKKITTKTWATTNEIIPITATFNNKGTRTVSAQFKGIITKNDKIVKVIESEEINVQPNEEIDLEIFYTPQDIGQYKVSGRVYFNNKITYEKGTIINVNEEEKNTKNFNYTIFLSIIIIVFATLVFLILRKKKRRKKY